MKHKITIEVEFSDTNDRNFRIWVARMAERWRADVTHELDGDVLQRFVAGETAEKNSELSLEQWMVDEYTRVNNEYSAGWDEVGNLLRSRDLESNSSSIKNMA